MRPVELLLGDLKIEGRSWAGDQTWFRLTPPGLALDAGRGAPQLAGAADVFVSHGHLDHVLGVPHILSQRSLHRGVHTRLFCPAEIAEPLAALIAATETLERARYRYELIPLVPGERCDLGREFTLEAFAVDHVVPTLGLHLWRRKRRLARALVGTPEEELAALRQRGVETSETVEELWLSYCADTGPGVFAAEPRIFASRVLLLECTFLAPDHRDRGGRYKHLHLDDIAGQEARFENETLVLHHLSRRYRIEELRREVERRLPRLAGRTRFLVDEE